MHVDGVIMYGQMKRLIEEEATDTRRRNHINQISGSPVYSRAAVQESRRRRGKNLLAVCDPRLDAHSFRILAMSRRAGGPRTRSDITSDDHRLWAAAIMQQVLADGIVK